MVAGEQGFRVGFAAIQTKMLVTTEQRAVGERRAGAAARESAERQMASRSPRRRRARLGPVPAVVVSFRLAAALGSVGAWSRMALSSPARLSARNGRSPVRSW